MKGKTREKKKKKKRKGENVETETQHSKCQPKHTLNNIIEKRFNVIILPCHISLNLNQDGLISTVVDLD